MFSQQILRPPAEFLSWMITQYTAEAIARRLRREGHHVETALDGFQAIEAAQNFRPDFALIDIGLPKLNGCEVAQKIREQRWGRRILLIALTGWGQEQDRERSKNAGFDAHRVKPLIPLN